MSMIVRVGSASFTLVFKLTVATDASARTAATGLGTAPTVTISKNGGGFNAVHVPGVTEMANGWYKQTLDATDLDTAGPLIVRASGSGTDVWEDLFQVTNGIAANVMQWNASNVATPDTTGYPKVTIKDGVGAGELDMTAGAVLVHDWDANGVDALVNNVRDAVGNDGTGTPYDPLVDSLQAHTAGIAGAQSSPPLHSGLARGGSTTTIRLAATAPVTTIFVGCIVQINGGTGAGQERPILSYDTTTQTATMDDPWAVAPDNTSTYDVWPGRSYVAKVPGSVGSVAGNVSGNLNGNVVGSVASVTAPVTAGTLTDKTGMALSTAAIDAILTRPMTEAYAALGGQLTLASALYELVQGLEASGAASGFITIKKRDGTTTALVIQALGATGDPVTLSRTT